MFRAWLLTLLVSASAYAQPATAPATQPARLTFLTYNVLADPALARERVPALLKILGDSDADVIALQEVTPWFLKAMQREGWAKRYHQVPEGTEQPRGGLVILSKLRPVGHAYRDVTSRQRRGVLVVHYRVDGRHLAVATVHLESPLEAGETRARQLKQVFPLLKEADDAVLLGDYNFSEGWQPETGVLPKDFVDVWKTVKPDDVGYTWNIEVSPMAKAGSFPNEKSGRIDRILIRSDRWKPVDAKVLGDKAVDERGQVFPSDHFGLMGAVGR
jgi:endonuclease/exonuclease/phosphatase family metal-dependent hydrolase